MAQTFVVTVALSATGERAGLLAMASTLHRRGVVVVEADLSKPLHGRRVFSATFAAEPAMAVTVLHSFENLIDVVDASLYQALDTRQVDVRPPAHAAR